MEALRICLQDLTPQQLNKLKRLAQNQDMSSITVNKIVEIVEEAGLDMERLQRLAAEREAQRDGKNAPKKSNKIPVNSPCPCGSGIKYKKCCSKIG